MQPGNAALGAQFLVENCVEAHRESRLLLLMDHDVMLHIGRKDDDFTVLGRDAMMVSNKVNPECCVRQVMA